MRSARHGNARQNLAGPTPRFGAVATAVPPHVLEQDDIAARVKAQFSSSAVVQRLLPVFTNTGIERRYSCVPVEWYYDSHGWPDRNAIYLQSAVDLLERAALEALSQSGKRVEDVDTIVTVSTTGIATPSLEALLLERLPFKRTVQRLPIFGLGCAGGALGVARAASMARAQPASTVLLLVVELCALSFRRDDITKSNVVATALFGDGAAAAVISTECSGPVILGSGEYTFADSLDIMGWDVADDGLRAIFSRDIPQLVQTQLQPIVRDFLANHDLDIPDLDIVIAHPGGTKVIDALEEAFAMPAGGMEDSRAVLREYGNMSAVTVMFVLQRAMRRGALSNGNARYALMTAMGPGFTAGFVLLGT